MVILLMAWRNIWRNRNRSLIIMGSVALGLLAGLFVLSLYKGIMKDRIRSVVDKEVSHIQIHHPKFKEDFDPGFILQKEISNKLSSVNSIVKFTTRTISQGMLTTGTGSSGMQFIGVDPRSENSVSQLNSKIIEGDGFSPDRKNQALIGKKLADKMHLKLNSKIILTCTDQENNIISGAFRVAGIYQTENTPRDERVLYVRQTDLNALLSMKEDYHEIAILLKNDFEVGNTQAELKTIFPDLLVESWEEISTETKLMIDTTDQYSAIFIIIIMFALSFGIINTMLMAVLERSREIGMLLALGMNRFKLFSMILAETVFLTLTGVPVGIVVTWIIVIFYQQYGLDISTLGGEAMSSFGFSAIIYPAFPWEKLLNEMMIVVIAAFASSLLPAIKAIRLQPVEALQK